MLVAADGCLLRVSFGKSSGESLAARYYLSQLVVESTSIETGHAGSLSDMFVGQMRMRWDSMPDDHGHTVCLRLALDRLSPVLH